MQRRVFRSAATAVVESALLILLVSLCAGPAGAQESTAAGLSALEFERLLRELDVKRQPWAGIPWKISVTEARQAAAEAGKPVFLVVNTGNCLGFV